MYKYAQIVEPGKIELCEEEEPKLEKGEIRFDVKAVGICGTDAHLVFDKEPFREMQPLPYPFRFGHEVLAVITEFGEGAPRKDTFGEPIKEGDRVVFYGGSGECGRCYACRVMLQPRFCLNRGHGMGSGFAEKGVIPANSYIYRVSDEIPDEVAVLTEPMAVACISLEKSLYSSVPDKAMGFGPGKTVAIIGDGIIGVLLTVMSRICGAGKIILIGENENRLKLAKECGASVVLNREDFSSLEEKIEHVNKLTPHNMGPDVVFEAVGSPDVFVEAVKLVRIGGLLMEIGHWTYRGTVDFNPTLLCQKQIELRGLLGYSGMEFGTVQNLFNVYQDKYPFKKLVTHTFPLEKIQEALELAKTHQCMKGVIKP